MVELIISMMLGGLFAIAGINTAIAAKQGKLTSALAGMAILIALTVLAIIWFGGIFQ